MTTDDHPLPDAWPRDDAPHTSVDRCEDPWSLSGRLVDDDDDAVACAAGAVRAAASGDSFSMWVIALDEHCWSTGVIVQVPELWDVPPSGGAAVVLTRLWHMLAQLDPLGSVIVALASPGGGDRGRREVAWADALAEAGRVCELPLRAVVTVGAHRARLLHSAVPR